MKQILPFNKGAYLLSQKDVVKNGTLLLIF